MTRDVLVSVKGLQLTDPDSKSEPIEVITVGEYYYRNGHHYVRYEEMMEGFEGSTSNLIKADQERMEVQRKGATNVHMVFDKDKKNLTYYQTPYGGMEMAISASRIHCTESEKKIDIHVDYALEMNYEHVADCFIEVNIRPRTEEAFQG